MLISQDSVQPTVSTSENLILFIQAIEKVSEGLQGDDSYWVTLSCLQTEILKEIQPGTNFKIPIQNSPEAIGGVLARYSENVLARIIDVSEHHSWRSALHKWKILDQGCSVKSLLPFADLNKISSDLHTLLPAPDRTYSVSNISNASIHFLIKRQVYADGRLGQGSLFMTDTRNIGTTLTGTIRPPLKFTVPKDLNDEPLFLIASGNGISPYIYFLETLKRDQCKNPITLILLTRDKDSDWLISQFKKYLPDLNLSISIVHTGLAKKIIQLMGQEYVDREYHEEARQKLIPDYMTHLNINHSNFFVYVCGSIPFSKYVLDILKEQLGPTVFAKRIASSQISVEAFSFTEL